MKILISFLIFLISLNISYCQIFESPPGTLKITDTLFLDVAPVDNLMFLEFLNNRNNIPLAKLDSILYNSASFGLDKAILFDINKKSNNIEIIYYSESEKYLRHPKYANYPVINLDKNIAMAYCEWRSKMVLINYAMKSNSEKERNNYPKNLKYRLPTTEEFNLAIKAFGYSKGIKPEEKNIPFSIYRKKYKSKYKKAIFIENNLSEYTLDSLPFGENWKNANPTNESNNYTSFRCVCEILE